MHQNKYLDLRAMAIGLGVDDQELKCQGCLKRRGRSVVSIPDSFEYYPASTVCPNVELKATDSNLIVHGKGMR